MSQSEPQEAVLGLIPQPRHVERRAGAFALARALLHVDETAHGEADAAWALLAPWLRRCGSHFDVASGGPRVVFAALPAEGPAEGYELKIEAEAISLRARSSLGFLHAVQTLRQLLPVACETEEGEVAAAATLPALLVQDHPRFAWRGLHVDVSRHWFPLPALKRLLDAMALHKLNRLHWHLTDDQGWRLEIRGWPRLTEVGGRRRESPRYGARLEGDGVPYAGAYTQGEARELVDYAAQRGIEIVAEIELPGHAQAALAAYPELGHGQAPEVWTRWGISKRIFNVKDATFAFLKDVLTQVAAIFPFGLLHLGGDEVPTEEWERDSDAQARMQTENLASPQDLQGWFLRRASAILERLGRRAIGWDEVLACGAPPSAAIMTWRDEAYAREAAAQGHEVILCPMSHCYFDHYQGPEESEPEAIGGHTDLAKVLSFEPGEGDWSAEERARLLGIQGNLWSEYIPDESQLGYMAWPRGAALAEVAWSEGGARDLEDFRRRWAFLAPRLDALGVNHRREA